MEKEKEKKETFSKKEIVVHFRHSSQHTEEHMKVTIAFNVAEI